MDFLIHHVEAIVFCATKPVKLVDINKCLTEMFEVEVPEEDVKEAISRLVTKYESDNFAFQILKIAGGYQFLTKPAYQASIGILLKQQSKKRLSNSAMETLSIITYKQPVTKSEIEQIRGVNCDYAVHKLLEKELVQILGKAETIGRPMLYGTSSYFMEYFGINSLAELPTPKDFAQEENSIGGEYVSELRLDEEE